MENIIENILNNCKVIDLHSYVFPYEYQELCLYGIDNLLTCQYLISELFSVWDDLTSEEFYKLNKIKQADIIWLELFIKRIPISESCREVIIILNTLGLNEYIQNRNLTEIRNSLSNINSSNIDKYTEQILNLSNIDYIIMSNQIFEKKEVKYLDKIFIFSKGNTVTYKKNDEIFQANIIDCHRQMGDPGSYSIRFNNGREKNTLWKYLFMSDITFNEITKRFKTSIKIDYLIQNYNKTIKNGLLKQYGFDENIDGVKDYIRYWNHFLRPEYFVASLEYGFCYNSSECEKKWFGSPSQVIDNIIIPLAHEMNLPINLKFGCQKISESPLKEENVFNIESLFNLCRKYPKCKFLVTFLSQVNHNQLCILSKFFPNLLIYENFFCYKNSNLLDKMINFTERHNRVNVLEQLLYKWNYSKKKIAKILNKQYQNLQEIGWKLTQEEIEKDINYLFRDTYLNFMNKKL